MKSLLGTGRMFIKPGDFISMTESELKKSAPRDTRKISTCSING